MHKYPKIKNYFKRGYDGILSNVATMREPLLVNDGWIATEKIDGMNIRLYSKAGSGRMTIAGRTDRAVFTEQQSAFLESVLTIEKIRKVCPSNVDICVYGELYGHKIQSGGGYVLNKGLGFRVFDISIANTWVNFYDVEKMCGVMGLKMVPTLFFGDSGHILREVKKGYKSIVSFIEGDGSKLIEGVVCRTDPLLLNRHGERVIWKAKTIDLVKRELENIEDDGQGNG